MDLKQILEKYFKEALTEEAVKEIETIFEATVNEKVNEKSEQVITEKEEALEEKNTEELTAFKTEIIEKLNDYVEMAVNEFTETYENEIKSSIKTDIAEKAIESLKTVFIENYVEIPESEIDVIKSLEEKVESANKTLSEAVEEKIELKKQCFEYEKVINFNKLTESLSDVKKEKVLSLCEGLIFNDIEDFETKVNIIIEKIVDKEFKKEKTLTEEFESEIDAYLPK